jgi:hypothetical protein
MPPTNNCPNCGRTSPPGVSFCASCGSNLSSTSGGKGWKLLLGVVALFAGLLWVSVIYTQKSPSTQLAGATQPQGLLSPGGGYNSSAPQAAPPTPSPSLALTGAQHLAEARRALADGYKPNKDPQKAAWGEVAAAKWHLKAIGAPAPEYREAQELLKEVTRREKQIELAKQAKGGEGSSESVEAATSSPSSAYSSTPSSPAAPRQSPPAGTSSDDYYTNSDGVSVHRPVVSPNGPPEGATAQCRDGSYSFSLHRSGTCSHHGGVSRWL